MRERRKLYHMKYQYLYSSLSTTGDVISKQWLWNLRYDGGGEQEGIELEIFFFKAGFKISQLE
jgi:hypothetical protein